MRMMILASGLAVACVLAAGCRKEEEAVGTGDAPSSSEALNRKARSIAILKTQGVPYIDHLPVIETEANSTRRTGEEVALRTIALCVVAVKGEGLDQGTVDKLVAEYKITEHLTPKEQQFIRNPNPSKHDRVQFAWRYECYWVMLWALGFIDDLGKPDSICDVPRAVAFLKDNGRDGFLRKARLRPQSQILEAADLIYRYHWAVVEARLKGKDPPASLDPGVVMERHHALNWLIGYADQQWDDVSTDT